MMDGGGGGRGGGSNGGSDPTEMFVDSLIFKFNSHETQLIKPKIITTLR